jgi:hypothetical protein
MCRNEVMILAQLRKYLPSRHRNTLLGEITHDLVDHIVVTRIHHAGHHDFKGVNSAAFFHQTQVGSGPEAKSHVAAGVQAIRGVGCELHGEIPRSFRDCVRHFGSLFAWSHFWQFNSMNSQQKDRYASKCDHQKCDPDKQSHGLYPLSMSVCRV